MIIYPGVDLQNKVISIFRQDLVGNIGTPGLTDLIRWTPRFQLELIRYCPTGVGDIWTIKGHTYQFDGVVKKGDSMPAGISSQSQFYLIPNGVGMVFRKRTELGTRALQNFEYFHKLSAGKATAEQVQNSSAGIEGWSESAPAETEPARPSTTQTAFVPGAANQNFRSCGVGPTDAPPQDDGLAAMRAEPAKVHSERIEREKARMAESAERALTYQHLVEGMHSKMAQQSAERADFQESIVFGMVHFLKQQGLQGADIQSLVHRAIFKQAHPRDEPVR
jgi:hypothetical protein